MYLGIDLISEDPVALRRWEDNFLFSLPLYFSATYSI